MLQLIGGCACVCFGLLMFFMRIKQPHKLRKFEAMKASYGEKKAAVIHTIFYTYHL